MEPLKPLSSLDPAKKKAMTLLEEFKNFAFKGSVIDLAVGVIIGAAFGNIIKSLVDNIIMPLVSLVIPSDQDYTKWALTINSKSVPFGKFLGDVVNFLIIALVLYIFIVKFLGFLMKAKQAEAVAPPLSKDQQLLTEIRDLLRKDAVPPVHP